MSSNDVEVGGEGRSAEVFEALGDELSRRILSEATAETVTASSLSELLDVAPATVYRRLNRLNELRLIQEVTDIRQVPSSETGYRTDVQTVVMMVSSSGFGVMRAGSELRAGLSLVLDRLDVSEATFSFDEGTATVTLSMDDETLEELHDSYQALTGENSRPVDTDTGS